MILSGDSAIGDSAIKEDRTDPRPSGPRYDKLSSQFFRTSGFASLPVCLSIEEQARTDFRYLGEQKVHRSLTQVLVFAQHIDPAAVLVLFKAGKWSVPVLLQGICWINPDNGEIVQMRTELLAPQPAAELSRVGTRAFFAKVDLSARPSAMLLPKEVDVWINAFGRMYFNRHRYADYQVFTVQHRLLPANAPGAAPRP